MAGRVASFGHKCYVGNLPWTVADRQLKEYFSQFGNVSHAIVLFDKTNGMSKGFGFVTFSSTQSLNAVNNKPVHMLEGQALNIKTVNRSQQVE